MTVGSKLRSSVESLETIYAVVVAFAVTKAIEGILYVTPEDQADYTLLLRHSRELAAFVATIAPFYHGMHRHLNRVYLEKELQHSKHGFLLLDFLAFFVESCILLVFASSLSLGIEAFKPLIALLLIDSAWAIAAHSIHYREWRSSPWIWAAINLVAILIMLFFLSPLMNISDDLRLWTLCLLAIMRTMMDYKLCWEFYFPNEHGK